MKKLLSFLLLASAVGLAVPALKDADFVPVKADATNTVYVDFGPGVFNANQTGVSEERFNPSIYSIAYRGGANEAAIMLFPNVNAYEDIAFNTTVPVAELVDTDYSKVRIYTSETSYKTIDYYFSRGENSASYNIFSDAAQNVSFFLNRTNLPTKDIYKITFDEGFVLPYPSSDHSTKYVLKETLTFVSRYYGVSTQVDLVTASEWTRLSYTDEKEEEGDDEGIVLEDIAAFSRTDSKREDYRVHVRGSHIGAEHFENPALLDIDDYTCRLYLFFGDVDYNSEIYGQYNIPIPADKMDVSDSETSYLHTLYEKVLFEMEDGTTLMLKDLSDPATKGLPMYNASGENGCLVFNIGNFGDESLPNFNARSFNRVTVLRGAQFPSYRYTHLGTTAEYRYQQVDDISVSLNPSRYVLWSTYAELNFNAADINVTSIGTRKVDIATDSLTLSGVVLDIGLSECNFGDSVNQPILTIGEKMTKYIYINGRALYYAYGHDTIQAYANLDGKTDTISIVIPENAPSDITEIIVQQGCLIPSLVASSVTMEIYGGYVSYYVLSTASYELKGDVYQETEKIYWTLWFEGKNPVRIENGKTYDFDTAPAGETNDRQRFVRWVNENGESVSGYKRISGVFPKEFFGVYIYSQIVEFKNIDHEFSVKVDRFTRLTNVDEVQSIIIPTRAGYSFQGWVDEDGNHYNMGNRVTRDMVLTATWISTSDSYTVNNDSTLLVVTIVVGSLGGLLLVADLVLILLKKKAK